ncbi:MAG: sensor histidine kinase [Acidimicrobiales bacterium]
MLSLVSNRHDYWQAVLVVATTFGVLNVATSTEWGWIPASVVLVAVFVRMAWTGMPTWLLLALVLVPTVVAEASAVGDSGFLVVTVLLAGVATEPASRMTLALSSAAVLSPFGLWAARIDDYQDHGPWTWAAGLLLGWLFGAAIGRLWQLVDELQESRAQLAESAARQERNRIARELHDLVGHNFSVVLLHMAGARATLRSSPADAEAALLQAEQVGREGMNDLREALTLMRSGGEPAKPVETVAALDDLVERYRRAGLDVAVSVDGPLESIATTAALLVQDVVREGLTNAAKHAPSESVSITISVVADEVHVSVTNALAGPVPPHRTAGYGLVGLRERIEAVGGRFDAAVGSSEGRDAWHLSTFVPRALDRVAGPLETTPLEKTP